MEYKFTGALNFDDFVQAQRVALKSVFFTRKIIINFCLILFIFTFYLKYFTKGISLRDTTTLVVIVGFAALLIVLLVMFNSKRIYRKSFETNKLIAEECEYTINEEQILVTSESGSSILNHGNIYKIVFDKDSIYLFMGTNTAKAIKKRFLRDEEEYDSLVTFIKNNYGDKIKGKKRT
ncbi:YcxB family protein [Breznakiella homolactica]|uniref:YcxB family protein n=1 Tax=Breznakiella homolactica TaxID=2798577 RepID=A0A7T7XPJ2_9SPIR|nr:YcxB family protein [Breznakiella homolactica]QQO10125.1 YcxB family protein [Breznakiella homolactica]